MRRLALAPLLFILSLPAGAKTITTSYLRLNIPDHWTCESIEPSWVCRSTLPQEQNSAALVITAKRSNPEEDLTKLKSYLARQRTVSGPGNAVITSQLQWVRDINLRSLPWLEALQNNAEIYGFYSYYLATVAGGLTILINFNYEIKKSQLFFPLLGPIRDSIVITPTDDPFAAEDIPIPQPLPAADSPDSPLNGSTQAAVPLWKGPAFWVAVGALVCLLLLAILW